jgi:hypothetical protein
MSPLRHRGQQLDAIYPATAIYLLLTSSQFCSDGSTPLRCGCNRSLAFQGSCSAMFLQVHCVSSHCGGCIHHSQASYQHLRAGYLAMSDKKRGALQSMVALSRFGRCILQVNCACSGRKPILKKVYSPLEEKAMIGPDHSSIVAKKRFSTARSRGLHVTFSDRSCNMLIGLKFIACSSLHVRVPSHGWWS